MTKFLELIRMENVMYIRKSLDGVRVTLEQESKLYSKFSSRIIHLSGCFRDHWIDEDLDWKVDLSPARDIFPLQESRPLVCRVRAIVSIFPLSWFGVRCFCQFPLLIPVSISSCQFHKVHTLLCFLPLFARHIC